MLAFAPGQFGGRPFSSTGGISHKIIDSCKRETGTEGPLMPDMPDVPDMLPSPQARHDVSATENTGGPRGSLSCTRASALLVRNGGSHTKPAGSIASLWSSSAASGRAPMPVLVRGPAGSSTTCAGDLFGPLTWRSSWLPVERKAQPSQMCDFTTAQGPRATARGRLG